MLLPFFFFFNDTATSEIYTLSLHDALPIFRSVGVLGAGQMGLGIAQAAARAGFDTIMAKDRKSTRLNSSHITISYAVFCLKKKTIKLIQASDDLDVTHDYFDCRTSNKDWIA